MGVRVLAGILLSLCLASCVSCESSGKKGKVVSTLLDAKWASTPFWLEAAEYLAEEGGEEAFWEAMDFLAEEEGNLGKTSDRDLYDRVVSFAGRFLSWTHLNLLKLSLSLRTKSPRIEMFQQMSLDRGVPDAGCGQGAFVLEAAGGLHCSLEAAREALKNDEGAKRSPEVFKVDHHYPRRDPSAPTAVLYAEPGSAGFNEIHARLKGMAQRGEVDYVLRPYLTKRGTQKTRLSGFGVELQIKSSEYKAQDDRKVQVDGEEGDGDDHEDDKAEEVEGFDFKKLNELHPDDKEKLGELKQHLLDQNNDMAPMKVWEVQDLSLQAAERVLSSPKEKQLKVLTDIAHNFPSQAKSLSKITVRKEIKKEVKKNSEQFMMNMNMHPSDAALFINGMFFDMDYVDIFTILETLKSEGRVLDGLGKLGLTDEQARKLIVQDFSSTKITYGVDVRDTAVNWINDIEKDKLYKNWPESVSELLRPAFPGMLRSIRKNLFNVVIMCDPSKREAMGLIKLLESFFVHRAPTRIGIVFAVTDSVEATGKTDAGVAFLDAFNYISMNKEKADALSFITDVYATIDDDHVGDVTVEHVHQVFLDNYGADAKLDEVFDEDSEYDIGRQLAKDFVERSGFKKHPQVLMNGVPMEEKKLDAESFEEELMMSIMRATNELQRAVYHNKLKESDDVLDYLMKQSNIMPRLNDRVLKTSSSSGGEDDSDASDEYVDMIGDVLPALRVETFSAADRATKSATLADNLNYIAGKDGDNKLHILSSWVVADLETEQGREILRGAVTHVKSSKQMRATVVHNSASPGLISKIVKATFDTLENAPAKNLLAKVLKEDTVKKLLSGKKNLADYDIPGADTTALAKAVEKLEGKDFEVDAVFCESVLGLSKGQNMVLLNGKKIGPLDEGEVFGEDDFNLMEKFSMTKYGDKMVNNYYSFMDLSAAKLSDQAMKVTSVLLTRIQTRSRNTISYYGDKHSVIKLEPIMPDKPAFDIAALVDPSSTGAQKIAPLLQVLSKTVNAKIRVFLNCVEKHSEMPQKSYYRAVLNPELQFNDDGSLAAGPSARFANLPEEPILTMHYHIPDNWLVEPVRSVYDLDNIKLASVSSGGGVHSEFELEYLLLEGHCFEAVTGNPPRGLQLTMGTQKDAVVGDTIVMANLGYLQLKSTPGRWFLDLREGRSAELYDIISHEGTEDNSKDGKIQVLMDSFQSKIIKLRVQKKPDKRNEELLEADTQESQEGGLWDSLTATLTGSKKEDGEGDGEEDNTINIFCLASGHLYERLIKIMMLSSMRNTDAKIKFWVLKNFLSPSLKEFLPEYSRRYGFEYEYVQYKWPRWLNQQKEKQRIIWGYKILFLDVMFPLDVKKIIFVDTDQIVRADLTELRDLDLKGAPYGYTPFCDSNKDMEGFRFWKSGYWKNHLAGRPYHISALYVVDLARFRRIAAGDRLRGQYQALSQDPNSLSNLDQDLPNNMIHQVPIFSLPQEWLWCETWCDQASKVPAKSIDLCNNPLTKESKLDAARRIAPEWNLLDEEMRLLGEEITSGVSLSKTGPVKQEGGGEKHKDKHTEL